MGKMKEIDIQWVNFLAQLDLTEIIYLIEHDKRAECGHLELLNRDGECQVCKGRK